MRALEYWYTPIYIHQEKRELRNATPLSATCRGGKVLSADEAHMGNRHPHDIYAFLQALQHGHQTREMPRRLIELAHSALGRGRARAGLEPGDVVADLILSLLERRDAVDRLLALPAGQLEPVLRRRLFQVVVEASPAWAFLKALRAQVRAALEVQVRTQPSAPLSILEHGRLSQPLVQSAVAHAIADHPELDEGHFPGDGPSRRRQVRAVAAHLVERYEVLPGAVSACANDEPNEDQLRGIENVDTRRDAHTLGHAVERYLTPHLRRALSLRRRGHAFAEIARAEGIGLATAHARVQEGVAQMARFARRHGLGPSQMEVVLQQLAA